MYPQVKPVWHHRVDFLKSIPKDGQRAALRERPLLVTHAQIRLVRRLIVPVLRLVEDPIVMGNTSQHVNSQADRRPVGTREQRENSLRSSGIKLPPKRHPNKLLQVTSNFDSAHIRRVPLRANIIVLHDASGIEVVHEWLGSFAGLRRLLGHSIIDNWVPEVIIRVEPFVHLIDLVDETLGRVGEVGVAGLVEAKPERLVVGERTGECGAHQMVNNVISKM